jgi:hypothetical protein
MENLMNTLSKAAVVTTLLAIVGAGAAYAQRDWHRGWEGGRGPMGGRMLARLCASNDPITGDRFASRLTERLQVTDNQKPALKDLQDAFAKSMTDAKSLCSEKPDFSTITGRIAFAQKRLSVMAASLATVQPKLEAFYATLDDKQKEEFNHMRPFGHRHRGWDGGWREWHGHGWDHGWDGDRDD